MVIDDSVESITNNYRKGSKIKDMSNNNKDNNKFSNRKNSDGGDNEKEDEFDDGSTNLPDEKTNDLNEIINNLMNIQKKGLWSEKCEAAKALLFLYTEFHDDLKISSSKYLINQLDLFNDDSWQVI